MKLIFVVGMHRSGTSMVVGALARLGVDWNERGNAPIVTGSDNPNGFYENANFVKLNDLILEMLHGSWYDPPPKDKILGLLDNKKIMGEAQALFDKTMRNSLGVWGWKDPRTAITFPLWRAIIEESGIEDVNVVEIVRNPEAIAKSLYARNSIGYSEALTLTENYCARLEKARIERPCKWGWLKIEYEDMLFNSLFHVKALNDQLELQASPQQIQDAVDSIRPELNHGGKID